MKDILILSADTLVITSATSAAGTVGSFLSYQITATNSPTNYGGQDPLAGLTVSTASGLMSRTPRRSAPIQSRSAPPTAAPAPGPPP